VHPYLIHSGHIFLPTFGVLAAIALMAGLGLSERCARLVGLDAERLWDAGLFAIVAAFVLSRALLVAQNWHTFLNFPILLLAVPSLTPTGVLLAGAATLLYLRWKRVPMLSALDAWAAPATLIWAALALGHFFEGSDPGVPTRSFLGMTSAGQSSPHHPVALYAAAVGLALTVLIYRRLQQKPAAGQTAGWTLVLTGVGQFLLSFLREPGAGSLLGLDALQWVAVALIACGGCVVAFAPGADPVE
jgi:phosphatidylglycerol:prolipoprotein diacylglycerol transferase